MLAVVGHLVTLVFMREMANLSVVKITMLCLHRAVEGVVSLLWIAIYLPLVHIGIQSASYVR